MHESLFFMFYLHINLFDAIYGSTQTNWAACLNNMGISFEQDAHVAPNKHTARNNVTGGPMRYPHLSARTSPMATNNASMSAGKTSPMLPMRNVSASDIFPG